MALEKLEWESEVSALPYYMGDWQDAECTRYLTPGIYVLKGCQHVCPQFLDDLGFQPLMEMAELEVRRGDPVNLEAAVWVEMIRAWCEEPLWQSTRQIFRNSRCPNRLYRTLHPMVADVLMQEWVSNCLDERCDPGRVGVVVRCSGPAGFVAVRQLSEEVEQIDLLGVRPESRGQGWGKALAAWAVQTMETDCLRVRTELENVAALKVYESVGFQLVSTDLLYWAKVEC